jgi:hypothetical protein
MFYFLTMENLDLLRFQSSFHVCVAALETDPIKKMPIKPAEHDERLLRESASGHFKPQPGIMVKENVYAKSPILYWIAAVLLIPVRARRMATPPC